MNAFTNETEENIEAALSAFNVALIEAKAIAAIEDDSGISMRAAKSAWIKYVTVATPVCWSHFACEHAESVWNLAYPIA